MTISNLPWQQCFFFFTPAGSGHHKTFKLAKLSPRVESRLQTCVDQITMKVVTGVALLLLNVCLSRSCFQEGQVLFCLDIPAAFTPGHSSLVMILEDVGEINSTVLNSEDLTSVTRLRIENAGVTRIAGEAFGSFQNLTNLSLNQNLLTEINSNWFGRPDILTELSLTGNRIEVLSEFMLEMLISLTSLNLSKNRIRTIDPNTFSSQTVLAELDLSENRLTRVSPQVFRSLGSTRIRLDGNPWRCSCGAEDFVDFVKDLQNRSLLDRPAEVTCDRPPSLKGRPVCNVSVCETPPSVTPTTQPKPTDIITTVQTSPVVTTRPPSETRTSVRSKPTDAPTVMSSHTATPQAGPTSETRTSIQPKPDSLTATETYVTSPPSVTQISLHPKPSDLPSHTLSPPTGVTDICVTSQPSSEATNVCTLVVVIMVLSLLLFAVGFLVLLHWRKRSKKTVMPGCPQDNGKESIEGSRRSSRAQSAGNSEERGNSQWDAEVGQRRSFTGVRAKSANAVLLTSPFCAPAKDQVTEAQSKDTENRAEEKQTQRSETVADGRVETENLADTSDVREAADDKNPHCVSVNTDTVPYLSIGTNQHKPDDVNKQTTDGSGQTSQMRKVMGRISTWPPTAIQWQERCKKMEKEKEEAAVKFPGEKPLNNMEHLSETDQDKQEKDIEKNQAEDPLKTNDQMKPGQSTTLNDNETSFSESRAHNNTRRETTTPTEDPTTARQPQLLVSLSETKSLNLGNLGQTRDLKPAEKGTDGRNKKREQRREAKRAVTSRQLAENTTSKGSKGPAGGASPDDETLLSGNEYAFMDLLHEVVQNNGRWTRERWRQTHVNKQRRKDTELHKASDS